MDNADRLVNIGCAVPKNEEDRYTQENLINRAAECVAAGQTEKGLRMYNSGGFYLNQRHGDRAASASLHSGETLQNFEEMLRLFQEKANAFPHGDMSTDPQSG